MPQAYELNELLEEMIEDEKAGASKSTKLSQAEIAKMVREERRVSSTKGCRCELHLGEVPIHHSPVTLESLLEYFVSSNASDMLIASGVPPSVKYRKGLERTNMPAIKEEECVLLAKSLMSEKQWEEFLARKELDFSIDHDNCGRFRVNAYRQRNTISLSLRHISDVIPSLHALGIPAWLEEFAIRPQGLIIFAAPAGHGKTTSLHALVNIINIKRKCNIITLEDPIEYVHTSRKSNVNQREIGTDTNSFSEGLRQIFRQAPDVIVIGEMRDSETFEVAVRAALSGHLVLSTLHATSTTAALDNMINYLPQHLQSRARQQLSEALLMVFSQRLIPAGGSGAVIVAYEKLINSRRIKNLIREDKALQIIAQIEEDSEDFMSLDACLMRLIWEGKITIEEVLPFAENMEYVNRAGINE